MYMRNFTMAYGRQVFKQTESAIEVEGHYIVRKNGVDYMLEKDGIQWYGTPSDDFPVGLTLGERFGMTINFSSLVYNEEYKAYDLEIDEDYIISFAFLNGKLTYVRMIDEYDSMQIDFKDIGTTVVEAPDFIIVEPEEDVVE